MVRCTVWICKALPLIAFAMVLSAAMAKEEPWEVLPPTPSLPKAARSGTLAVSGVRIWYAEFGQGSPVILLHGGLGNADYWGLQVPALALRYRAIVLDSRGHGRSSWDGKPVTYHQMAEDVIGVMDVLHLEKASVVGWSDGAIIGLDLAVHHPQRLSGLFAFAANSNTAGVKDPQGSTTFATYHHRTEAEYRKLSPAPGQFEAFSNSLMKMWETEPDFTDQQLRTIRVPTWIVDGDRDEFIKREDTDRMARLIPGAGELILPRVSHFAILQDPELFNQVLLHFLAGGH